MLSHPRARIISAAALGGLLVSGVLYFGLRSDDEQVPLGSVELVSFDDCSQLEDHLRTHGRELVDAQRDTGNYSGLFSGEPALWSGTVPESAKDLGREAATDGAAQSDDSNSTSSDSNSTQSETGTNVQVAGVDEADFAKRSGDLLLSVGHGQDYGLRVIRIGDGSAEVLSTLPTPGWTPSSLLVDGTTVVLIGRTEGQSIIQPQPSESEATRRPTPVQPARTRLMQINLADPAHPVVVSTLDLDGEPGAARLVDGVLRVAVTSLPTGLDLVTPTSSDDQALTRAWEENRKRIDASTAQDWLPSYRVWQGAGPEWDDTGAVPAASGQLLGCAQVQTPAEFSGLVTTSLVSADLRAPDGIQGWQAGGVLARGTTMYATAEHTYLATTEWPTWTNPTTTWQPARTLIHLFDTAGAQAPRYLASGEVPGTLLNQFAMDEFDGVLRVASTKQDAIDTNPAALDSDVEIMPSPVGEAQVTVLRQDGNRLATIGSVDGLGIDERIYAVRFLGEVGYVVTFRQTDPLYTVDLRDPTAPKVSGELKLLGYSAYLHPFGSGQLLGIGRDATAEGRTTGLAVSLFDVVDPAAPSRVDQAVVPDAWSAAEQDHHAVTVADGLLLLPLSGGMVEMSSDNGSTLTMMADSGVLAVRVGEDGLGEPTQLRAYGDASKPTSIEEYTGTVLRTFVVDGAIWTLTTNGVAVHDASTLRWQSYTAFTFR